jgi:hypothetical protein
VWKELKLENDQTSYMVAFVPLTEYPGGGFKDLSKEGFVLAETIGAYFFNEIAPNVCRVTRIQTVDLHFKVLQKTLLDKAIDYLAKNELVEANRLQEKFRRNGKKVDAEVREALVERMREGVELEEDQKKVFGELEELFGGEDEKGWGPLESPYEGVKMDIKSKLKEEGHLLESFAALGRAFGTVDCTAEEAAAWLFEYCSRERMALSREEGNPARLEVRERERGLHEKVFATVKKAPFLLHNREFVMKWLWKVENGKVTVGWVPEDRSIDYGGGLGKLVRGTSAGLVLLENTSSVGSLPQCNILLQQSTNAGGKVPIYFINRNAAKQLGVIKMLSDTFRQDEEVDEAVLASLANIIKNEPQDYSDEEKAAIRKGRDLYMKCKESVRTYALKSRDEKVKMKGVRVDGESLGSGVATTIVDASLEECTAHEISRLNSRAKMNNLTKLGIVELTVEKVNGHSLYFFTTRDLGIPGFALREFRTKITWQKVTLEGRDTIWIDLKSTEDLQKKHPVKRGNIVASIHTFWVFEELKCKGKVPQTKVTLQSHVNLHSPIPTAIMNGLGAGVLTSASALRKKFDKSREIDSESRLELVEKINDLEVIGNEKLNSKFVDVEGKQKVEGAFPLSDTWIKVERKGEGWGKTTMTVRAGLEEAAAYFWDFESRVHQETIGDVERVVEEKKGTWEVVVRRRQKLESKQGVKNIDREFWNVMKLHKMDENTIVIIMEPIMENMERSDAVSNTERSAAQSLSGLLRSTAQSAVSNTQRSTAQRASEEVAMMFTKRGEKTTKVEFVTKVELGSSVIVEATRSTLERYLDEAAEAQRYFIDLVPLMEMSKQAGEALGADLVWDGGQLGGAHLRKDRERHVEEVCKENVALREVVKKYPWFVTLLKRARLCEFSSNSSVSTKLVCVEEKEARVIGNNLMPCLKSRKVIKAGVDMWRLQNRAVGELFEEFPWMEGMFVELGKGVVKAAPWGLTFRVTVGAVTSIFDLLTDVYVTYMFLSDKKYGYFKASLASLMVSIGIQMFTVWGQNRKLGMVKVVRECFPILIGFKPAVDAYRVATGEKQDAEQAFDALTEMTYMKGIEMFAEAIPGVIIQLMAIATNDGDVSDAAWVSLSVSALTTGYASATISYDWDTDPVKREQVPDFYGYVPANPTKRSIIFVAMMFFSASMLLIRCMTIVVLGLLDGKWSFLYIGADLGLYLFVKALREDFWYWIPLGGNAEFVNSIACRVMVKVVGDFTSIVHFRHPNEIGGMYWMFGFVLTIGSLPIAIFLAERGDGADEGHKLAWKFVGIFIPCAVLLFAVFFFNIEKKYWGTFYSLQRGKDMTVKNFQEGAEDVKAKYIFKYSKHHWKSIEEEVRAWIEANWVRWLEEKPKWFDDAMRARVPVEYIPGAGDARRRESVRRASVNADAEGGLAGALKAGIRRASVGGAAGGVMEVVGGGKAKVSSVVPLEDMDGE